MGSLNLALLNNLGRLLNNSLNGDIGLGQGELRSEDNTLGLVNLGLSNGGVGNNLGSLDGLIVNKGFNSVLRDIFNLGFISILGNIFGDMFDLLIVGIGLLNGLIDSLVHGLVFGDSSGDWHVFSSGLGNVFSVLSFIWNLLLNNLSFIVNISFLDRNILNVRAILGGGLSVDNGGLDNGLNQRLLNIGGTRLNIGGDGLNKGNGDLVGDLRLSLLA